MEGKEMGHRRRRGVMYRGHSGSGCYKVLHWTLADGDTRELWSELCCDCFAS